MIEKIQSVTIATSSGPKTAGVTVTPRRFPKPHYDIDAVCENAKAHMTVTKHPNAGLSDEQFERDLARAVQMCAEEAAGHARSHELLAKIVDPPAPAPQEARANAPKSS